MAQVFLGYICFRKLSRNRCSARTVSSKRPSRMRTPRPTRRNWFMWWQRGVTKFLIGLFFMVGVVMLAAALRSKDVPMFLAQLQQMFGIAWPEAANLSGAWGKFWQPNYRIPIIAAHVGLSLSMALWPA